MNSAVTPASSTTAAAFDPWIFSVEDYESYIKAKDITLEEDLANRSVGFTYFIQLNELLKL